MVIQPKAFTLIELLVVVTIIVVLLALLTPALDKAIEQAELAICGTNLKTVASGATVYATGSQRKFPHRKALGDNGQAPQLNDPYRGGGTPQNTDDRLTIKDYI